MTREQLCEKIEEVLGAMDFKGTYVSYERYGSGHINDTFLVVTEEMGEEHRYILQRMNHSIFKDPVGLMKNISGVTGYLRSMIMEKGGDPNRETLNIIPDKTGQNYFIDSIGCYWRAYLYISDAFSYDKVEKPEDFYESGKAFGRFQGMLSGYPATDLNETIPDFHNTPVRYANLEKAIAADRCNRVSLVLEEIKFIRERKEELSLAVNLLNAGKLPLRVTHNDTKLNNIMIDNKTGTGICVIDLDTIMPGLSINDFGDAIRFGANTAKEDEQDLSKVSLSLELYEIYVKGYLEGCEGSLTHQELHMLPMGAKLMTMECGIRFLTDYLEGDVYFNIHREHQNLDRARTQFALAADMERKWNQMEEIISHTVI